MKRVFMLIVIILLCCPAIVAVWADNPFTSKSETRQKAPEPLFKSQFFMKIIQWQNQLKQAMSELIRGAQKDGSLEPLFLLLGLAFLYGAIHAAGPGHGKFIAMSYVLSHKISILTGLLCGLFIALLHGFSGAVGVLGLCYLIQRGVSETLTAAIATTQIVSFGLIALLGLGVFLKNGYKLFFSSVSNHETSLPKASRKGLLPWVMAVGLVPCPGVVMVLLFCISMEEMVLGLILAACISLGMAATISFVVTTVVTGKTWALNAVSKKRIATIEACIKILSGAAIAIFGGIFLLTAINAALP